MVVIPLVHRNSRKQGDAGLGAAIGWYTAHGYTVCVPLTDSQDYDLVVDRGDGLQRVQAKTSWYQPRGRYIVSLRTMGGNQSWSGVVKKFDADRVEALFVLTASGDKYVIPSAVLRGKSTVTLGREYEVFHVD